MTTESEHLLPEDPKPEHGPSPLASKPDRAEDGASAKQKQAVTLDSIFEKLSRVDDGLDRQAAERKGTGISALVALCAAGFYFGSSYFFPNAGKQQKPIAVEFTSMEINQALLQNTYNDNLHQLFANLPGSPSTTPKFSAPTLDVINNIILVNTNVTSSARLASGMSSFLPILVSDFKAQIASEALSLAEKNKIKEAFHGLKKTNEEFETCQNKLDAETAAYRAGTANNASSDAQARVWIQMTTTLTDLVRNKSEAMTCMQKIDQFTTTFAQLAKMHDDGITEFNDHAEQDAWRLALYRSIAGLLLFFVGNPTRSFIQRQFGKLTSKNRN